MRRPLVLAASLLALALPACGDDAATPITDEGFDDGLDESGTGFDEVGETGSDEDTSTDTGTGTETDTGTTTGEPLPPPPSTGIQIIDVTVDQGIRVPIVRYGNPVAPNQRNADLLRDRPGLLRAFYLLEEGFVERDIYAVLTLELDGESRSFEVVQKAFAADDCPDPQQQFECRYASTIGSFNFRIPPEWMRPGLAYKIETFEAAPGQEDTPTAAIPHYPWEGGMQSVGVVDSYMKMRVVLVPVQHTISNSCAEAPDLSQPYGTNYEGEELSVAEYFAMRLAAHNPVDEVEVIVRDPVGWDGDLDDGSLLGGLAQLRNQDNAPPEQYYYAVATPCANFPEFSGIAQLGGPSKNAASSRVGWGVWHPNISTTADTFVHEIGHEQGRQHVACSGEEGGPDPFYPNNTGDTDSYGTDVFRKPTDTHPKTDHDYMSYCQSTWVSEYGWQQVTPWIATISSWELGDGGELERVPLLFGQVGADGQARWWVAEDYWDPGALRGSERIELRVGGELVADQPGLRIETDHSEGYMLVAPLLAGELAGELSWLDREGVRRELAVDAGPRLRELD